MYILRHHLSGRFPKFTRGLNRLEISLHIPFLTRLKTIVNFGQRRWCDCIIAIKPL
jgi:hypothetical protein